MHGFLSVCSQRSFIENRSTKGASDGYDRAPATIRDAAHAHDAKLREDGVLIGIAGTPVQMRNPEAAQVETTIGLFMSSRLPSAGFAVFEATDLAEAVKMVSQSPCAVAPVSSRCGRSARPKRLSVSADVP